MHLKFLLLGIFSFPPRESIFYDLKKYAQGKKQIIHSIYKVSSSFTCILCPEAALDLNHQSSQRVLVEVLYPRRDCSKILPNCIVCGLHTLWLSQGSKKGTMIYVCMEGKGGQWEFCSLLKEYDDCPLEILINIHQSLLSQFHFLRFQLSTANLVRSR